MQGVGKNLKRWKITGISFIILFFVLLISSIIYILGSITYVQELSCNNYCLSEGYSRGNVIIEEGCECYGSYLLNTHGGEYIINTYLSEE